MPYITNITVQHEGCILLILTDFDLLTNYSSMKLTSFCKPQGMYLLLTQIILPNTYHFEIVLLPNTIPLNPPSFCKKEKMKLLPLVHLPEYSILE